MTLHRAIAIMTLTEALTGLLVIGFLVLIAQVSGLVEFGTYLIALGVMLGKERLYKWLSTQHEKQPIPKLAMPLPTLGLIAGLAAGFLLVPEMLRAGILETLARDTLWLVLLAFVYGLIAYTGIVETVMSMVRRKH